MFERKCPGAPHGQKLTRPFQTFPAICTECGPGSSTISRTTVGLLVQGSASQQQVPLSDEPQRGGHWGSCRSELRTGGRGSGVKWPGDRRFCNTARKNCTVCLSVTLPHARL